MSRSFVLARGTSPFHVHSWIATTMRRFLASMLLIAVIGVTSFGGTGSASARQPAADEAAIRTAVNDIARFQQDENAEALYDRMAPDLRNVMPRSIWVAWYGLDPGLVPDGPPTISSMDIGEWTWPVTDETLDDVASVEIEQSGTRDGEAVTESQTLHFVEVDNRWRWFADVDPDEIDAEVQDADALPTYKSKFSSKTNAAIDTFWGQNFAAAGVDYAPPSNIVGATRNAQVGSGCGTAKDIQEYGIYYCTIDESIYFDPAFRDTVIDGLGEWAWTSVIAHEWGHHVQDLLGIDYSAQPELDNGFYTIEIELQADCMDGMFNQNQFALGAIGDDEIEEARAITNAAGDTPDTRWDDSSAHGTGDQRETSFLNGFDNGFTGCRVDLAS